MTDHYNHTNPSKDTRTIRQKQEGAQKILSEYMEWATKLGQCAFRGQADDEWKLESSAWRRLKNTVQDSRIERFFSERKGEGAADVAHSIFVNYLCERIEEARTRFSEYREKTDLEIMAELQHYGGATGLIDFTDSALIALWFACKDEPDKDGKVFAIRLDDSEKIKEIDNKDLQKDIKELFGTEEPGNELWAWNPGDRISRMVTQQSWFIFGPPVIDIEESRCRTFDNIPSKDKQSLLKILEVLGASETSVFPDFFGFAAANSYQARVGLDKILPRNLREAIEKLNQGLSRFYEGCLKEALKAINEAIRLEPELEEAHRGKGATLHRMGCLKEALKAIDEAIRLEPKSADAHLIKGGILYSQDDFGGALKAVDEAIRLEPKSAKAYLGKGSILHSQGDFEEALKAIDEAIELEPELADAHFIKGDILHSQGDFEGALKAIDEAIRLKPKWAKAYLGKGVILHSQGNFEEALKAIDEAIRLEPKDAISHWVQGNILFELKRREEACDAWVKAKELAEKSGNREIAEAASEALDEHCKGD